jgi:lycopene cyclase domain-containing protein
VLDNYTYFLILAASLGGPLLLSFDKKVAFFSKRKAVFGAMILPGIFYLAWDMLFTEIGIWSFNPRFITGIYGYNLPIEEILFFLVVPYCCTFIYECVRCYLPNLYENKNTNTAFRFVGLLFIVCSFFVTDKAYTFYTLLFTGSFITLFYFFPSWNKGFRTSAFLLSFAISLIPFLIVNGMLTSIPVVIYNHNQNMNLRIGTIPIEDTIYGMLLIMWNIYGFEKKMKRLR